MSKPLRKPTQKDLVAILTWAAHNVSSAKSTLYNDRDPNSFEKAVNRLEMVHEHLLRAAGHFPAPSSYSPWANDPVCHQPPKTCTCGREPCVCASDEDATRHYAEA